MPQGGLTDEQQAAARELAFDALVRFRDGGCARRPRRPPTTTCSRIMEFAVGGAEHGASTCRCSRRSWRYRGEDRRAPGWRKDDVAPGRRLPRRRSSAPACRACSPRTGCSRPASPFVDPREERRRRRHLVREQLSGLPGRQPEPQLQLLVRPAPRLAVPLLDPGRAARLLPRCADDVRPARRTSGSAPRSRRPTWSDDDRDVDGARAHGRRHARRRSRPTPSISAVGQLNRPSLPRHRRARARSPGPSFHSAAVGPRRRPRAASGSRSSAPAPARCSSSPRSRRASGELLVFQRTPPWLGPDARLPRRGAGRAAVAVRATCRPTASGTASGSSGRWATARSPTCAVDPRRGSRRTASVSAINDFDAA